MDYTWCIFIANVEWLKIYAENRDPYANFIAKRSIDGCDNSSCGRVLLMDTVYCECSFEHSSLKRLVLSTHEIDDLNKFSFSAIQNILIIQQCRQIV